jgi:beta-1,4-mannosyl-glycoprotein beta-1,4-N-acetylglucosaminyltransferase
MIDCFPFFNELDLLEIRLNIHYDVVEYFVIAESDRTHSGIPKPLYFQENADRFKKFWPKIVHLVHTGVDIYNTKGEGVTADYNHVNWSWFNDNGLRNHVLACLNIVRPSDGLLMISDADEILDPDKLVEARDLALATGEPVALSLKHSMYWLNYASVVGDYEIRAPYIFNPDTISEWHRDKFMAADNDISSIRWHVVASGYENDFRTIKNAGWHFSTMGGIEQMRKKLESFAHHTDVNNEHYTSLNNMIKRMVRGQHLYDTNLKETFTIQPIEFLPKYVQDNLDKYAEFII